MTFEQWKSQAAITLQNEWGLDKAFSLLVAVFYAYLVQYGLNPKITSGFRSPAKQAELLQRYQAGDNSIVVKPAANSKHSVTKWGKPSSLAVDISTNNPNLAARIASAVGIKPGLYFSSPDPVHFYA